MSKALIKQEELGSLTEIQREVVESGLVKNNNDYTDISCYSDYSNWGQYSDYRGNK